MRTPELITKVNLPSGLRLEVATRGRGPAVLFLHGYTDSWRSFEGILARLPEDVRGVAFSQRGHGGSARPPGGYTIAEMAADAAALLDATGIAEAVVVGHSMGSAVAQELALSRPERVSRLVLVGAATSFDHAGVREVEAAVGQLDDPVPFEFAWSFQASTVHRPVPESLLSKVSCESLKVPARVWRDALAGTLAFRSAERLARLTMPTLIVWGDHDEIAPLAEQERLLTGIPDARLLCYEDTGHSPHWELPERFTEDLLAFTREGRVRRAAAG